jgi:hypothetical protein
LQVVYKDEVLTYLSKNIGISWLTDYALLPTTSTELLVRLAPGQVIFCQKDALANAVSTGVEHSTHNLEIEDSNPATSIQR